MAKSHLVVDSPTFIGIDVVLKPSFCKRLVWTASLLVVVLMISLLPLPFAYKIMALFAALVGLWFEQISHYHLLVISSLVANPRAKPQQLAHEKFDFLTWQLQLVRGVVKVPWVNNLAASRQDVWQANLVDIIDMGCMVILRFNVIEPQQHKISVRVWQDQVDRDSWRQLKILAR